jgi:hypothetical protein
MSDFRWHGDEALVFLREAAQEALQAGAQVYAQAMHDVLSAVDNQGPAPPGEAPHEESLMASRRGYTPLAESVQIYPGAEDAEQPELFVGTGHPGAPWLERGTHDMLARPAWEMTLVNYLDVIEGAMQEAFAQAWRTRGG